MKIKEPFGDFPACDCCEIYDGRQTLHWEDRDFDLCLECLDRLFFEHIAPSYKVKEKVIIARTVISEKLRDEVMQKCDNKCVTCQTIEKLEIDHIKPFSLGGTTELDNLQVLCKPCNLRKGKSYGER